MSLIPPFRSDNIASACPEVLEAIARAGHGPSPAYGTDHWSTALDDAMSDVFERRCWCFPVGTGTAANALALAGISQPGTRIACHAGAHILKNEDAAVQLFSPGVELEPLPGEAGRITTGALDDLVSRMDASASGRWSALSLTQLTEAGTVYTLEQTAFLAAIAHRCGARTHLDGARFANAVVALDAAPADLSWRSGIDVLSFGATKNGTMCADAVVAFDADVAHAIRSHLKRSGQLYSKMRFMAAQLLALLKDNLWLQNARHANYMAEQLRERLSACRGVELAYPVQGNHLFLRLEEALVHKLAKADSIPWRSGTDELGHPIYRLVTSFATESGEIEHFGSLLD